MEGGWNRPVRGCVVPNIVYVAEIYGWNDSIVVPQAWDQAEGLGKDGVRMVCLVELDAEADTIISFSALFWSP